MYIYIDQDEDLWGLVFTELLCPVCGNVNTGVVISCDNIDIPYRVLRYPIKCETCGQMDSIVAKSKAEFIDLTCFPGKYNLAKERQEAVKRKKEEVKRKKELNGFFSKANLQVLSLLLLLLLLLLVLGISLFVASFFLYKLLELVITSQEMLLYCSVGIVLTVAAIAEPFLEKETSLLVDVISWPLKVNRLLGLSQLIRLLIFITITVVDLSNSSYLFQENQWHLIKAAIYPAIVTSLLVESYVKAIRQSKKNDTTPPSLAPPKKRETIRERRMRKKEEKIKREHLEEELHRFVEEHEEKKVRTVDDDYLDVLQYDLGLLTMGKIREFSTEIYNLIKRDFTGFFTDVDMSEDEIKIPNVVQWYRKTTNGGNE